MTTPPTLPTRPPQDDKRWPLRARVFVRVLGWFFALRDRLRGRRG